MARLIIHTKRIQRNIDCLHKLFSEHGIHWSLITKVFSGDKEFLQQLLTEEVIQQIDTVGDSRLTSLKNLRAVNPDMRTIYIKPPAAMYVDEVVKYADVSLNSSLTTMKLLSKAAEKQGKIHQVILMVEMGELREGVRQDEVMSVYEQAYQLPGIRVIGVGSNLGCMYGVEPSFEKLDVLRMLREDIEKQFGTQLRYISAGTSITLPLIEEGNIPKEVNHFRVGEAIFFGVSPLKNEVFRDLSTDTFEFEANIIEIEEKELVPDGVINDASIGHSIDFEEKEAYEKSTKAILDFGLLDVEEGDLESLDPEMTFVGMTSDMLVVDIGDNRTKAGEKKYSVGDKVYFKTNYMAVARLLNSKFIDKEFR